MVRRLPPLPLPLPCGELSVAKEIMAGTNANIDSGLWLHHMVTFIKGPGRWDPTCKFFFFFFLIRGTGCGVVCACG